MPETERPSSNNHSDVVDNNPPAFPTDTASLADNDNASEVLPEYSRHSNDPQLPSYARATRHRSRPSQTMTPEERMASLEAFIASKLETNDTLGGLKGEVEGPPNNPLKPFQWIKRKMQGEKDVWRKLTDEQRKKWEEDGREVEIGDIDQSRII